MTEPALEDARPFRDHPARLQERDAEKSALAWREAPRGLATPAPVAPLGSGTGPVSELAAPLPDGLSVRAAHTAGLLGVTPTAAAL